MLVESDRAPVVGLTTALGLTVARVIAMTALLGGCAGSPDTTSVAQVSTFDTSLAHQASATITMSDVTKYCPVGPILTEQNPDNGDIYQSSFSIEGNICSVEKSLNGNKKTFDTALGAIPYSSYTNYNEIAEKLASIVTGNEENSIVHQIGSHWGVHQDVLATLTKINESQVVIGGVTYPSVEIRLESHSALGFYENLDMTFSFLPNGTIFPSKVVSTNPAHRWPTFIVKMVSYQPLPQL